MRNILFKCIVGLFLISTTFYTKAQGDPGLDEIQGTFTIYIKSLKESKEALSEGQLSEIESLRKDSEDFKTSIGDIKVLIMSREKMEADFRWPKYSLLNK